MKHRYIFTQISSLNLDVPLTNFSASSLRMRRGRRTKFRRYITIEANVGTAATWLSKENVEWAKAVVYIFDFISCVACRHSAGYRSNVHNPSTLRHRGNTAKPCLTTYLLIAFPQQIIRHEDASKTFASTKHYPYLCCFKPNVQS